MTCLIPEMSAIFLLKPVCLWPLVWERAINRKRKATSGEKWWKYDHSRHVKGRKMVDGMIFFWFCSLKLRYMVHIFEPAIRLRVSYFIPMYPIKKLKLNATVFSSFSLTKNWRCSQRTFFSTTFGLQAAHMLLLFELGKVQRWDLHNEGLMWFQISCIWMRSLVAYMGRLTRTLDCGKAMLWDS